MALRTDMVLVRSKREWCDAGSVAPCPCYRKAMRGERGEPEKFTNFGALNIHLLILLRENKFPLRLWHVSVHHE